MWEWCDNNRDTRNAADRHSHRQTEAVDSVYKNCVFCTEQTRTTPVFSGDDDDLIADSSSDCI